MATQEDLNEEMNDKMSSFLHQEMADRNIETVDDLIQKQKLKAISQ